MKTRLIFVRHGESEGNLRGVFSGQLDYPLTETGRAQAVSAAGALADTRIDAVYSSDLSRAYETGRIIAGERGLSVTRDRDLRELHAGEWQGRTFVSLTERPEYQAWRRDRGHVRCPGGESYEDLMRRVRLACGRIAGREEGKTVLIAAHAGVLRAMMLVSRGMDVSQVDRLERIENASFFIAEYEDGRWSPVCREPGEE